jgi:hypothetical protein
MCDNNSNGQKNPEKYLELYEERRHLENLLNTRFNFFLVVFAAILAALFTITNLSQFQLILILGASIESLFAIVIARAQLKLGFFLKVIRAIPNHAENASTIFANSKGTCFLIKGSRNWIVGYFLPITISLGLIIASFFPKNIYDSLSNSSPQNVLKIELSKNSVPLKDYCLTLDSDNTINLLINLNQLENQSQKPAQDSVETKK